MSKQRTKKPTTGRRIVESWISTGQAGKKPIGAVWYEPVHSDLARRIDRAIAAAVRKERYECCTRVRMCVQPGPLLVSIIEEINRP